MADKESFQFEISLPVAGFSATRETMARTKPKPSPRQPRPTGMSDAPRGDHCATSSDLRPNAST